MNQSSHEQAREGAGGGGGGGGLGGGGGGGGSLPRTVQLKLEACITGCCCCALHALHTTPTCVPRCMGWDT
jgi:hypothetical protein